MVDKYPKWVAEATNVMLKTNSSDNWNYVLWVREFNEMFLKHNKFEI